MLATQNPVEQEGTYPLPEAQLDRFMFLIELDYPSEDEEIEIARTTTGDELPELTHLLHAPRDHRAPESGPAGAGAGPHLYVCRAAGAQDAAARRHGAGLAEAAGGWGAGPRAVQNLILGRRARAALLGSYMVRLEDVQEVAAPVLTHRVITTFAAQAEGLGAKEIVRRLVEETSDEA